MLFVLLCCCLAALCQGVLGEGEFHINNASDLIDFSKNVKNGTSYSGTTVFLGADIDFSGGLSEQFEPIGKDAGKYFQGTFDGQGHTVSNLALNSSSQYVGLFGYSNGGATIRNVVLDSSCSIASSFNDSSNVVYIGGITGHCGAGNGPCVIENTVNMGSVSFTGNSSYLYLGGIVGHPPASNNDATVKNCANYGSIAHSGTVNSVAYIGGIVGFSQGSSSNKVFIQNCLSYGTINQNGTTNILYIGGILGYAYGTNNIENCECM